MKSNQTKLAGRRLMKVIIAVLLVMLGLAIFELPQLVSETTGFTSFVANLVFSHNLHTASPGRFYRSAEMPGADLKSVIETYKIRTVVDLRAGKDEGSGDGVFEKDVVSQAGAAYIHLPLLGSREPNKQSLEQLLTLFDTAQEPILVHCTTGTHRSGLATAIWMMSRDNQPLEVAKEQLSPRYGFFRFERQLKAALQGHPTIDNVLWRYEQAHAESGKGIREWIRDDYSPTNESTKR